MVSFAIRHWRAMVAAFLSVASMTLISLFPKMWVLLLVGFVWIGSLVVMSIFPASFRKKVSLLPLIIITAMSFVLLASIVEWTGLSWFLRLASGFIIGFLFFQQKQRQRNILAHARKPFRRINMMLWVFVGYTFLTIIFAFHLFFPGIPFWLFLIFAAVGMSTISFMIWRLYYDLEFKQSLIWLLLVGVVIVELVWVMNVLPFGYFVSGFLVTWIWYILQLLLRFHFSKRGIDWKKQTKFLIFNGVLFFVCMFLIRWI